MRLLSINIGKATPINAKSGLTGIYKQPVQGPVAISRLGVPGDAICDTENHGGADQAVYVFGEPDYAHWWQVLGHEIAPGTFGENLTIAGLESSNMNVGDELHIGSVVLQITCPRVPCVTLATRMGDPGFVVLFRKIERPGVYCRVLQEGEVCAGDEVILARYTGEVISIIEMFRNFYKPDHSEAALRRYLSAPISIRDRVEKEAQLAALSGE
jgi:MOSC domain-containing protein YiiM